MKALPKMRNVLDRPSARTIGMPNDVVGTSQRRLRMLHCCHRLTGGGAERQLVYLASYWAEAGHEVHLAFLAGSAVPGEVKQAGVNLHPLAYRGNHDPLLLPRLVGLIRAVRPDVVQTWILQMDVLAGLAAWLTGTPWLLREPISAEWWRDGLKTKLRRWIGSKADAVVSNSAGGDAYWAGNVHADRRFVIGNAVPVDRAIQTPAASPEELGVPADRPIIMFAGRLVDDKNLKVLVHALRRVVAETTAIGLILGEGPLQWSLHQLIAELRVSDRIFLPGAIPTIWGALKSADLFVSISKFEGRPNAVLEAMASRCPLIVSDIPAHREFLDSDTALFVARYTDPDCVAEAIIEGLADREAAARRWEAAFRRISDWNVPAIAGEYEKVYDIVLQRRSNWRNRSAIQQ